MPAPELRPYQVDVIERVRAEIADGRQRVLLVAPTGSGKTVIAARIVVNAREKGKRVLFVAHRRELTKQTSQKLYDVGLDHGIIQAGFPPRLSEPVQVASIQTLHARAVRSSTIEMPDFDVIIIDEAHHARAKTYQDIVDAFSDAVLIGLTATPCRGDGRGLGNIFQSLIECPQVHELVEEGYLVPTRVFAPTKPDLEGVRIKMGDYVEADLGERMDDPKLIGDIVEHWHRLADRQRTVVFAVNVAHSVHIRDEFLRSGVAAEHLDGKTPAEERDGILKRLADGSTEVVTNCQVLTEGWDCPAASCLVLARPTKSVGLYRQMAGRVLRPSDGKTHALIIDHAGAVHEHGFIDEPVEWVLSEDRRASHPKQEARKQGRAPMLVECPECGAIRWEGQPCTACGWRGRTKGSPVDVLEGELAELDRRRQAIEASKLVPQTFYCELMAIAETRGYSPGWAYHKYLEKFKGAKPPWSWRKLSPIAPSDATLAWVRSRQIAWAKSRSRAA